MRLVQIDARSQSGRIISLLILFLNLFCLFPSKAASKFLGLASFPGPHWPGNEARTALNLKLTTDRVRSCLHDSVPILSGVSYLCFVVFSHGQLQVTLL